MRQFPKILAIVMLLVFVDLVFGHAVAPVTRWFNDDLFFILHEKSSETHDVYEYGLKRKFQTREKFGPLHYQIYTNSLGFRDSGTHQIELAAQRTRWLFIGDSFTYGAGIPNYGDSFVARIDKQLPCVEALNAGVSSYSPANYYAKVRYFLETEQLKVDRVVVFVDMSDPIDELKRRVDAAGKVARAGAIAKSGSSNATPASVLAPRASGKLDPPSSSAENTSFRQWLRDHSLSVRLAYEVKDWILPPVKLERDFDLDIHRAKGMWPMDGDDGLRRRAKTGLARAGQSMDRLATFLQARGVPLVLAVYPWPHQIVSGEENSIQVRFWHDWSERHGVKLINLFPAFLSSPSPQDIIRRYFIAGDVHWNEAGHA